MYDVLRAELTKLRRRPAVWTLLGAAIVLNSVFSYIVPYLAYSSGDTSGFTDGQPLETVLAGMMPDQIVPNTISAFPVFAGALALVLGALATGGEHGFGTVKTLLTQRPGRLVVAAGQSAALVVTVALGVAALFVVGLATSVGIGLVEGQSLTWPSVQTLVEGYSSGVLVMSMWTLLGAALGTAMRGVALPIGLGVVWILGVELIVSSMATSVFDGLKGLRDVLPGVNAGSVVSQWISGEAPPGVDGYVSVERGLLTLAVYVALSVVLTLAVSRRRDVA